MMMSTPTTMQGQTVERSYGWADGSLYRRTLDRSDGSVSWAVADDESAAALADAGYGTGTEDHAPRVAEWTPCDEPA